MLYFILRIIHTHTENTHNYSHSPPPPPVPPHPPAVAPAVSAQRQAKCMLMRARPMVEPHSFWEEMAFNNGGPRGDFAQSSAPLLKNTFNSLLCLYTPSLLFSLPSKKKERENGLRIHLWPSRPCIYAGGRRSFGERRELWFFFITPLVNLFIVKLHLALPPCLSLLLCLCLCWDKCPQKNANCTVCISNRWYPLGPWAQNTSKRRGTIDK